MFIFVVFKPKLKQIVFFFTLNHVKSRVADVDNGNLARKAVGAYLTTESIYSVALVNGIDVRAD